MKWEETEASHCRYSECAEKIFGDANIIWEDSYGGYQGEVNCIGIKPDGTVIMYSYAYGSCSSCDDWECRSLSQEEIVKEKERDMITFTINEREALKKMVNSWGEKNPDTNFSNAFAPKRKETVKKYFGWE